MQGIRGWAVISVVIFHFFPSLLPYGFLGVDVFLVLSGYFIASVLFHKDPMCFWTHTDFYFKRVRRIFPMLLLVSYS